MEYNKDYTVWVSYHDDKLISEYNLVEDEHHKLFPTHKKPEEGLSVNVLNPVWSEIVTMWYVWKNNLKSEYVGFEHYRRHLNIAEMPRDHQCQIYTIIKHRNLTIYKYYSKYHRKNDLDIVIKILEKKFGKDNNYVYYFKNSVDMIGNCTFFMKWEDFDKMCNFLFPIIEEYSKKIGIRGKNKRSLDAWKRKAKRDFKKNIPYQTRVVSFLAERLIAAWIEENMIYYIY